MLASVVVKFKPKMATNNLSPSHDTMYSYDPSYGNGNDYAHATEEGTATHGEIDHWNMLASEEMARSEEQLGLIQLANAALGSAYNEPDESRERASPARPLSASASRPEAVNIMSPKPLARHPGTTPANTSISALFRNNRPRTSVLFPQYTPSLVDRGSRNLQYFMDGPHGCTK